MKDSFDTGDFTARSLLCSAILAFFSFSILPLSIAAVGTDERENLVKVFALEKSNSAMERKSESTKKTFDGTQSTGAAARPDFQIPRVSSDFSKLSVVAPEILSDGGSFVVSSFATEGVSADTGVVAFEISALDRVPKRLNEVRVKYPRELLKRGIEGEVRLNVSIDIDGSVDVESVASSTDSRFERYAVAAASKLRYEPPSKNGEPARARFVLPIPFRIMK